MYKPIVKNSPSRQKVFESCSWLYYAKYILKLPDIGNAGSSIGSCVHDVLETLLNKKKYYKYVNKIVKSQKLTKSLIRYLDKRLKKTNFYSEENLEKAKTYLLVALSNDFWMEGFELDKPEIQFVIDKEYKIGGFIDVRGVKKLPNGKVKIRVRDYKSSKIVFNDKELAFNLQFYTYILASLDDYPNMDLLESEIEFVFLQFPDNPIRRLKLKSLGELEGFEEYLKQSQKLLDGFDETKKEKWMAAKMGFPSKEEGFCKKLLCGFSKYPGHLKKDGSVMFACSAKNPFSYYVALDDTNKIKYSSFVESELEKHKKDGLTIEKREYLGCSAFNRKENNNNGEVVDDFEF